MARNSGKDAVSESLNTRSSVADTVQAQDTAAPVQILLRAIVVEVLYDPSVFPDEDMEELKSLVSAPELIQSAPRNSIIARVITAGADKKSADATEGVTEEEQQKAEESAEQVAEKEKIGKVGVLAYPFFPPHLCMPLKPGEQVWLVTESADVPSKIMYWMCRITEADHVDDVNYTHGDRKFSGSLAAKTSKEKADTASGSTSSSEAASSSSASGQAEGEKKSFDQNEDGLDDRIFGFPNGTGEDAGYTLDGEFTYEEIVNVSEAYRQFRTQDVPRYTKRPGDLVIQGSNNTLICLGEERGWTKDDEPGDSETSNATEGDDAIEEKKGGSWGTIDIVAGRGRYNWRMLGEEVDTATSEDPYPPAARVIKNSVDKDNGREQWVEVNKNPQESDNAEVNRKDNPTEGDPDYFGDAARIIVAHSTNADERFSISSAGETIPSPLGADSFGSYDFVNKEGENPSFVIAKSDEVRIIARRLSKDEPVDGAPEINGSIRLIKEGEPDEDLATIMLLPDGTVQITGSKIVIGRTADDGGAGDGPEDVDSNLQPYVKYQQLEDLLTTTMENIQSFCDTLLTHVTPGYGAPSPQINSAANALKSNMSSRIDDIPTVKSERIFGE